MRKILIVMVILLFASISVAAPPTVLKKRTSRKITKSMMAATQDAIKGIRFTENNGVYTVHVQLYLARQHQTLYFAFSDGDSSDGPWTKLRDVGLDRITQPAMGVSEQSFTLERTPDKLNINVNVGRMTPDGNIDGRYLVRSFPLEYECKLVLE